jgi:hypothetical protein
MCHCVRVMRVVRAACWTTLRVRVVHACRVLAVDPGPRLASKMARPKYAQAEGRSAPRLRRMRQNAAQCPWWVQCQASRLRAEWLCAGAGAGLFPPGVRLGIRLPARSLAGQPRPCRCPARSGSTLGPGPIPAGRARDRDLRAGPAWTRV